MIQNFFDFVEKCPTVFQTVAETEKRLKDNGFVPLPESCELEDGGKYYSVRSTSLIAFVYRKNARGFMISASHGDSPTYRLRLDCEKGASAYSVIDVEKYGGMLHYTWFDRPLSVAGRLVVRTEKGLEIRNVAPDRDLFVIPSLCIHMNRGANDGFKPDVATDMRPLFGRKDCKEDLLDILAKEAGTEKDNIVSHDLFLCVRQRGTVFGADNSLFLCPRLDDLGCVWACLEAFLNSDPGGSIPVFALYDNEEVGSSTKQGAAAPMLRDALERIAGDRYISMLRNSMMLSADNGHALHPNHAEVADSVYTPSLGDGVIVKFNASQKYATDGVSHAVFSEICKKADIKMKPYCNKANVLGGSTLGSISDTVVPVSTVDIGLPQLAMHSAVETGACSDLEQLLGAVRAFFGTSLECSGNGITIHN